MKPILVTHCGAGSTRRIQDAANTALAAGLQRLRGAGNALDAVERAIVSLEDDPKTNAGTGSRMRIDGSIQMDAALMDSRRRAGAVAAISRVKNPIRVARRVMATPHLMLAGPWADRFARDQGFLEYDPSTKQSRERLEEALRDIRSGKAAKWRKWLPRGTDTVGAVARDSRGRYAAGSSTGGVALMLPGRVGDSPVIGAGLYAGPRGAVTATGIGEEIWRLVLSKYVYDRLEDCGAQRACEDGLRLYPKRIPVGIIAVAADGAGEACNRDMAWATSAVNRVGKH
ncbi:MAG TPA: isoaspartyl peptidase/L-asparaginase [Thermoplasmata archaeon]|nr:isoaspartyl peptidase/L-asparaginase [Thermoplasmata archaeon]